MIHIFPFWRWLKLWALEAHDLALTKLERSIDRDLQDVMYLARAGFLQAGNTNRALSERDAAVPERANADLARHNPGNVGQRVLAG